MMRIAMWSCPRSLGTALMRAWGNRDDTFVIDEPFYGHYLARASVQHPDGAALQARLACDADEIIASLRAPRQAAIVYEKHMAHHVSLALVDALGPDVRHAFLVRHPARQLASLAKVVWPLAAEQTGWPALAEIFAHTGGGPVVIADELSRDPTATLQRLCAALAVPFVTAMCGWAAGPRDTDGAWAGAWYERALASTGFEPLAPLPEVAPRLERLYAQCMPIYERLTRSP